jgi:cytoskeleton protein RodZ
MLSLGKQSAMMPNEAMPGEGMPDENRGCGERLRKAREAAGLSVADVGARLKMPVRVVESLEAEDWSRLGAPVFVRGQLRSYGRLLGLTTAQVSATPGPSSMIEPSVLVPRTFTPPMQRAAEQLARRLVYIVITAAIAVPVWLATRPHLGMPAGDAAPLDLPASTLGARSENAPRDNNHRSVSPTPVVASMAALPGRSATAPSLVLKFNADSWVEVMAADGTTLEKALVSKGQQRSYEAGDVARMVLGNGAAVEVRKHGRLQDLTPYLRANVARFAVSSDGSLVPVAE